MIFGDFAAQPPELISGRIYSGPGVGPLLAAASAWDGLAADLQSTASAYESVLSGLISQSWQGPSAAAMAAAAFPYVTWLSTTAAQAEESAGQARAAASAYEAALAAVVPPEVVAANRSELASLLATNIFGQNNTAIEANEARYARMWAQDVAAMFGYASSSAAAQQLTSFTAAPEIVSGSAAAAASSTAAAATPTSVLTQLESIIQQITNAINTLTTDWSTFWENLITKITGNSQIATLWEDLFSLISSVGSQATWTNVINGTASLGISQWKNFFVYQPWALPLTRSSLAGGLSSPGQVASASLTSPASAALGSAQAVGALSVPPSWASATPAIRLAATALPDGNAAAGLAASLLGDASLGSFTGGALGTPAARVVASVGVQARPTTGKRTAPVKLDRVIAHLQQQPDVVQHWNVDEAGLDDLVAELSTKPGIHAVHVCADGETASATPKSQSG